MGADVRNSIRVVTYDSSDLIAFKLYLFVAQMCVCGGCAWVCADGTGEEGGYAWEGKRVCVWMGERWEGRECDDVMTHSRASERVG